MVFEIEVDCCHVRLSSGYRGVARLSPASPATVNPEFFINN